MGLSFNNGSVNYDGFKLSGRGSNNNKKPRRRTNKKKVKKGVKRLRSTTNCYCLQAISINACGKSILAPLQ